MNHDQPDTREDEGLTRLAEPPDGNQDAVQPVRGGMREKVRAFDWGATPLGPREQWPSELAIVVQQILDSGFPKAVIWGPDLITIFNDAFLPILGDKPEALGRSFKDIWSEVWDHIGPIADRAFAGSSTYIEDFPLTIQRSGAPEQAWFTFCYSPLRLADGSIAGMLDTVVETTDKVRAQSDLAAINRELAHRLKNTLALVQAIAFQTLGGKADVATMWAFNDRLAALGHAHDILLRQNWSGASMAQIVAASIKPHNGSRQIDAAGADFQVGSHTAVSLSLLLHELATNAAKYGALSTAGGHVRLRWETMGDSFGLHWQETGGPRAVEPEKAGFGTRLIDRGLGQGSEVVRRYEAEGFRLEVRTPLASLSV